MMVLSYIAYLEQDAPNDWAVVFPDVPEAVTGGASEEEAWQNAADALAVALLSYPKRGLPFPRPGKLREGTRLVDVPSIHAAKLYIHAKMASAGMTTADLARLIDTDHKTTRRILDLHHRTKMDQLEWILFKLDVRVTLVAA